MIPKQFLIASHNPDKIREITEILTEHGWQDRILAGVKWPEVSETGDTLEANAILKAEQVMLHTGLPALADDTGLEVDALGGRPGVRSARYAGEAASYQENCAKLLLEMSGISDRRARFRTVAAFAQPDQATVWAQGELTGEIATEPSGHGGFGYDPVFLVGGVSLADISPSEKNELSHRARAFTSLLGILSS